VDVIFSVCNQAIGALDAWATYAEEHERSLAGRIGRFIPRLPRAAHTESGSVRTAFIASVVGIPAAVAAGLITYLLGWG
jgi:hypothetical protein